MSSPDDRRELSNDYALQRLNMVESQVRPSDVTDRRIIRAMQSISRELFVPEAQRAMAYCDQPIVLDAKGSRHLLHPMLAARLIHTARIEPTHTVLEIGAATGYSTAILASLARRVIALESDAALVDQARATLAGLGLGNAEIVLGPLAEGWAAAAPYDIVLINGSVPDVPAGLLAQTLERGRLIAVLGDGWHGKAVTCEKVGKNWSQQFAFSIAAPALPGFAKPAVFAL